MVGSGLFVQFGNLALVAELAFASAAAPRNFWFRVASCNLCSASFVTPFSWLSIGPFLNTVLREVGCQAANKLDFSHDREPRFSNTGPRPL